MSSISDEFLCHARIVGSRPALSGGGSKRQTTTVPCFSLNAHTIMHTLTASFRNSEDSSKPHRFHA